VWRDIQAEGRKLSSKWSFNDKLERELIARWSFKEDCAGTWVKVLQEKEKVHSSKAKDGPKHSGETAKSPRERCRNKGFTVWLQSTKESK